MDIALLAHFVPTIFENIPLRFHLKKSELGLNGIC
jgi:hypothetical protein